MGESGAMNISVNPPGHADFLDTLTEAELDDYMEVALFQLEVGDG